MLSIRYGPLREAGELSWEISLAATPLADWQSGKTAIRTILGPQYAKVKKAPQVTDEDEAKALLGKILPK